MPLETLVTGRIATLAGRRRLRLGRGHRHPRWPRRVRRVGGVPRDPRRPVHPADPPRTRPGGDPGPDRRAPPSGPGGDRDAPGRPDDAPTLDEGLAPHRRGPRGAPDRTPGWRATAGTATDGAAGRRPTTSSASRPGRRAALWAHDHHALWASHAALRAGGDHAEPTIRPVASSGARRTGRRRACCSRPPTRLVTVHVPPLSPDDLAAAIVERRAGPRVARRRRLPRPGRRGAGPGPDATRSRSMRGSPTPAGCRSGSTPACATMRSRPPSSRGSGAATPLGDDPDGRASVGWQKCFADGSLGSRTAALLEDIEPEPDRPLRPIAGAASG